MNERLPNMTPYEMLLDVCVSLKKSVNQSLLLFRLMY
jgi:hypothetical protein